jgi:hypothetical protein
MIPCQRHLFDIPDNIAYLNCAYMSPLMKSVAAAGRAGMDRKLHPWEILSGHFFTEPDELRAWPAGFSTVNRTMWPLCLRPVMDWRQPR